MTVEQRLEQLEKRNKRLTVALTLMAVTMCAVVMMAATGDKIGKFDTVMADTVVARHIAVLNEAGTVLVGWGANDDGHGLVLTQSAKGKKLVQLNATVDGQGGMVKTYQPNGKELVRLGATENGGLVGVIKQTGEVIANLYADEYGNGLVGAYNRKGKGRTLQPGP